MGIVKWVIVLLVVLNAGFMVVDGLRALIVGSYITPSSGEHAGQLGPWTHLVKAIGIDPNSTLMKSIFVAYGAVWLIVLFFFLTGAKWAPTAMLAIAAGSLWYLWVGTVNAGIQIILLLIWILKQS